MADKIKAVIWDMGGVLIRTEDTSPRGLLAKDYDLTLDEISRLVFYGDSAMRATLGQIDEPTHWRNLGAQFGISGEKLRDFRHRFWEGDRLDQTLVNFIRSLKPSYTTGLLSNAWSNAREMITDSKPCVDAFDVSVFSCEIGLAKPDPTIYHYVLKLCHVEPAESIFIDDFTDNIDAANRVGMHGILFKNAAQAIQDVKAMLDHQ